MIVPVVLGLSGHLRASGRDCMWRDWVELMSGRLPWGLGPPGRFPGTCVPRWAHAHNELLQALTVGGVVGLCAAVIVFGGLTWFAVRYHAWDRRCLLSLMVCATTLMSLEVSGRAWNWIGARGWC